MRESKSRHSFDAFHQRVDVIFRRPAIAVEQAEHLAGAHHVERLAATQRQRPSLRVADQFDQHAAGPEHCEQPELRIMADADIDLDALPGERLHHARDGRRLEAQSAKCLIVTFPSRPQFVGTADSDRDQPVLGAVWNVVAHPLQDYRITDQVSRTNGFDNRAHDVVEHHIESKLPHYRLGVDLID